MARYPGLLTRKRQFVRWLLLLPLVLAGASSFAAEKVALQLRWHHQFQFAGYYMAKEKGFYREAGLEVELRPIRAGITPVDEVCSGRAEFGVGDTGLVVDRLQGKPVVAIACIFQHSPMTFVVKEDSGIRDVKDLAGKRVMLSPGYNSFALIALLQRANVFSRINRIDSSFNLDDLVAGRVDVFNGYVSNEPFALESQGIAYRLIRPQDYGIDFYGDVLFTREDFHDNRHDLAHALREASINGWRYALDHVEETIDVIEKNYPSQKTKAQLRYEANVIHEMMEPNLIEIGHMNPERWDRILQELNRTGAVFAKEIPSGFFCIHHYQGAWKELLPWVVGGVLLLLAVASLAIHLYSVNRKLAAALLEIRTLSGMLPICANCKKIRDDKGYWTQIEGYIQAHSEAKFSHSLCPECAKSLYGDMNLQSVQEYVGRRP